MSGKSHVIGGGGLGIGAATRLVAVEAVTYGGLAWHGGEADRSGLGGRRRSGGAEVSRSGGACSAVLSHSSSSKIGVAVGYASGGIVGGTL